MELRKRFLGEINLDVANSLYNVAHLYFSQGRYSEAEPFLGQALEIFEQRLGSNYPVTINCKKGLAIIRNRLDSTAVNLPDFNQKANKGNSKKKNKGFGKV